MADPTPSNGDLDDLLQSIATPDIPTDFSERVMAELARTRPLPPLWHRGWFQWLTLSVGLGFAAARLMAYIFGAWLALNAAW